MGERIDAIKEAKRGEELRAQRVILGGVAVSFILILVMFMG